MGALGSIEQPIFYISAMDWTYRIKRDDPVNGFKKGEVVKPVSYFVSHGRSSLTVDHMYLKTSDDRKMPVRLWEEEDDAENYYFIPVHYPEYDSTKYDERGYNLDLQFTSRIEIVDE